jgi:hypothetical protein
MSTYKSALILLAAVGVATAGACLVGVAAAQDKEAKAKQVAAASKAGDKTATALPFSDTSLSDTLRTIIDYQGFDDPAVKLCEALNQISKIHRITFAINESAFEAEGENDVIRTVYDTPFPPMRASLRAVLLAILARIDVKSGSTVLVRNDHIEVTTEAALRRELGFPPRRFDAKRRPLDALTVTVWEDYRQQPLDAALYELAAEGDTCVFFDPRVEQKAKVPVTATLRNVPLDRAVRLFADMGGLAALKLHDGYYVTSRGNAALWAGDDARPLVKVNEHASTRSASANDDKLPPRTNTHMRKALDTVIDFDGYDDPAVKLDDALIQLARAHRVAFKYNGDAFAAENIKRVSQIIISVPPVPAMKTSLRVVLTRLLSRINVYSGMMMMIRPDHIEITTKAAVRSELKLPPLKGKPLDWWLASPTILVWEEYRREPLDRALHELAEAMDVTIVLDPAVREKASVKVSANLHNVPIDSAVQHLADRAGLAVVQLGNAYYVTSPENAAQWKQ